MTNPHAQALGRIGGKATSKAKTAAARKNAKKGGWPKGRPRKPQEPRKTNGWEKASDCPADQA